LGQSAGGRCFDDARRELHQLAGRRLVSGFWMASSLHASAQGTTKQQEHRAIRIEQHHDYDIDHRHGAIIEPTLSLKCSSRTMDHGGLRFWLVACSTGLGDAVVVVLAR